MAKRSKKHADTEAPEIRKGLKHIKAASYSDTYANSCTVRVGPFDVSLTFSLTKPNDEETEVINEDRVTVNVSPQQFKSMVNVLSNTLTAYERHFGEIMLAEDLMRPRYTADEMAKLFAQAREGTKASSER